MDENTILRNGNFYHEENQVQQHQQPGDENERKENVPRIANGLLLASGSRKRSRRSEVPAHHRRIHSEPFVPPLVADDEFFSSSMWDDDLTNEEGNDWMQGIDFSLNIPTSSVKDARLDTLPMQEVVNNAVVDASIVFCDDISQEADVDMLDQFGQLNGFTPPTNIELRKHYGVPPPDLQQREAKNQFLQKNHLEIPTITSSKTQTKYHRRVVTDDTVCAQVAEMVVNDPSQNKQSSLRVKPLPQQLVHHQRQSLPPLPPPPLPHPYAQFLTSTEQSQPEIQEVDGENKAKMNDAISIKDRGRYRCGRCGQVKVNHQCPYELSTLRTIETQTDTLKLTEKTRWRSIYQRGIQHDTVQEIDAENAQTFNEISDRIIVAQKYVPSEEPRPLSLDSEMVEPIKSVLPLNDESTAGTVMAMPKKKSHPGNSIVDDATISANEDVVMDEMIVNVLSSPSPPQVGKHSKDERKRLLPGKLLIPDPNDHTIPPDQPTPGTPPKYTKASLSEAPPPPYDTDSNTPESTQNSPIRRAQSSPGILHRPEKVHRSESNNSVSCNVQSSTTTNIALDKRKQYLSPPPLGDLPEGIDLSAIMPPPPLPDRRPSSLSAETTIGKCHDLNRRPASYTGITPNGPYFTSAITTTSGTFGGSSNTTASTGQNNRPIPSLFPPPTQAALLAYDRDKFSQMSEAEKKKFIFQSSIPPPPPAVGASSVSARGVPSGLRPQQQVVQQSRNLVLQPALLAHRQPSTSTPTAQSKSHASSITTNITATNGQQNNCTADTQMAISSTTNNNTVALRITNNDGSTNVITHQPNYTQYTMQRHLNNLSMMRTQSAPQISDYSNIQQQQHPPTLHLQQLSSQQYQQQQVPQQQLVSQQKQQRKVIQSQSEEHRAGTIEEQPFVPQKEELTPATEAEPTNTSLQSILSLLPTMTPEQLQCIANATSNMVLSSNQQPPALIQKNTDASQQNH